MGICQAYHLQLLFFWRVYFEIVLWKVAEWVEYVHWWNLSRPVSIDMYIVLHPPCDYRLNQSSLNTFDYWVWNLPQTFIACAFIFNLISTCFKIHTVKKFKKKMACKKFSNVHTFEKINVICPKNLRKFQKWLCFHSCST